MSTVDKTDDDEESSELLGTKQKTSYATFEEDDTPTSWSFYTPLSSLWQSVKSYVPSWESMKYYLPSYKRLQTIFTSLLTVGPLFLFSAASVLPMLPYTFGFPSGTSPQFFSWEWFTALSLSYQLASIANSLIFLSAETIVRYDHFGGMLSRLINILNKCCASMADMISVLAILFFSGTAGIAAGGLGYDSYQWYPPLAAPSGVANGLVVVAFRIEFMSSFFNEIKKKFNKDAQFQQTIIQLLQQLKKERADEFDDLFRADEIDVETANEFLNALFDRALEAASETDDEAVFFNHPSQLEIALSCLKRGTDATIGTTFAAAFGAFFAVNGYIGLEILCHLILYECSMDTFEQHEQTIVAMITALSSSVLGFMTGLKLIDILKTSYDHIKKHPYDLIKLVGILVLCGVSASTMWNATQDVLGRDHLFGLTQGMIGSLFAAVNTTLIGTFCYDSLYRMLMKRQDKSFSIENFTAWLKTTELPKETIANLRSHGFFSKHHEASEEAMPILAHTKLLTV